MTTVISLVALSKLQDDGRVDAEISKREKARLKEMQKLKKQKIQEMLDKQNASIDADMVRTYWMPLLPCIILIWSVIVVQVTEYFI